MRRLSITGSVPNSGKHKLLTYFSKKPQHLVGSWAQPEFGTGPVKYIPQRDGRFGFPLGEDQDRVYMDPWGMRNVKDTQADISIYGGPSLRWLSRLNKDERAYVTYSSVEDSWVLIIEF